LHAITKNLGGSYVLMNDLDSTSAGYEKLASPTANGGEGWQPLLACRFWTGPPCYGFSGTFDGQGYEIHDLFINRPDEDCVALFSVVDPGGRIEDIGLVNVTVTGRGMVGGLVGVGYSGGTVTGSYSIGSVTGTDMVGGLVGVIWEGTVSNSYSTCSVSGGNGYGTGGVVGQNNGGTVSNCYATGSVTGGVRVGGLVGDSSGPLSNSYSTGTVTGEYFVGGLVGENGEGTVSNSFWDIQTSGQAASRVGTGKTTAEMKDITTFSGAGWNITAVALGQTNSAYIWNILDGLTYPFLSWPSVS